MDRQGGCTTLLYTVSCVAVAASPTRRSLLIETANGRGSVARCFIVSGRSYGLILATVCGLYYWFACYHIHRYVALSVIGHRMCNRISGLCDKSSITIYRYKALPGNIAHLLPTVLLLVLRTRNNTGQPTRDISRYRLVLW